jgi:hypothetical protein
MFRSPRLRISGLFRCSSTPPEVVQLAHPARQGAIQNRSYRVTQKRFDLNQPCLCIIQSANCTGVVGLFLFCGSRCAQCRLLADSVEKVVPAVETNFLSAADAFSAVRHAGPRRLEQKLSATFFFA